MVLDDGHHHDPVEDAANEATTNLQQERDARSDVILLGQSQILGKKLCLLHSVVGEACKVKVGEWSSREQVSSQHLADWLDVEAKSCHAELCAEE